MPNRNRDGRHIISLLIDPSFGDAENIEFRWNTFPSQYVCWHDMLPTIEYSQYQVKHQSGVLDDSWIMSPDLASNRKTRVINIETASFEAFLNCIRQTSLTPYTGMSVIDNDGTTYRLTIGSSASQVIYTWWHEPPPAWLQLGEIRSMMIDIVRRSKKRFE